MPIPDEWRDHLGAMRCYFEDVGGAIPIVSTDSEVLEFIENNYVGGVHRFIHDGDILDITVCIPSIPPRAKLLQRALASVQAQTLEPKAIAVAYDHEHKGHGLTRNDAINMAQTEWIAFLDDDDEMYPEHLAKLAAAQQVHDVDVVYPWYEVIGGTDPWPMWKFVPWDLTQHIPHSWAISCLVRKQVLLDAGGFAPYDDEWNPGSGGDWVLWHKVIQAGAKIFHLPEITWAWHHDSNNTSGQGDRW